MLCSARHISEHILSHNKLPNIFQFGVNTAPINNITSRIRVTLDTNVTRYKIGEQEGKKPFYKMVRQSTVCLQAHQSTVCLQRSRISRCDGQQPSDTYRERNDNIILNYTFFNNDDNLPDNWPTFVRISVSLVDS